MVLVVVGGGGVRVKFQRPLFYYLYYTSHLKRNMIIKMEFGVKRGVKNSALIIRRVIKLFKSSPIHRLFRQLVPIYHSIVGLIHSRWGTVSI